MSARTYRALSMTEQIELQDQRDELLEALKEARAQIFSDRQSLFDCHVVAETGRIPVDDIIGREAFNEYSRLINRLDGAIAKAEASK